MIRIRFNTVASRLSNKGDILKNTLTQQQRCNSVLVLGNRSLDAIHNIENMHRTLLAPKLIYETSGVFVKKQCFSTPGYGQGKRAFPAYTIFGETAVLTMKPMIPKFKTSGQDGNIINLSERGRMMFQFSPTSSSGIKWNENITFALSAEELGLLVSQLPYHPVTFVRELTSRQGSAFNDEKYDIVSDDDSVMKTFIVTPIEGASVHFEIDFKKNGIGGQMPPANSAERANGLSAPMRVVLQAGEWEVLKSLAQESIPYLLGWRKLMDIAIEDAIKNREV